jgi:hypothetical protein
MTDPMVAPLRVRRRPYSMVIAALGYERRARYAAECLSKDALFRRASGFTQRQVLSFEENRAWFRANGFAVALHDTDEAFAEWMASRVKELTQIERPTICVDISSFTSSRLALIVDAFRRSGRDGLEVDFVYSIARPDVKELSDVPNVHVGPVIPAFAGWWSEPEHGVAALVGLGLEENKAIGAIEHIQASDVWVFLPSSLDEAYDAAVKEANKIVLDFLPPFRRIGYRVERPFDTFVAVESLVARCRQSFNVVAFPFGPKILGLVFLLVASIYQDIAVWRVSSGQSEAPVEKVPSGVLAGIMARWSAEPSIGGR